MKPHLKRDKWSNKWVCQLKEHAVQRGVVAPVTLYVGIGATPMEAYQQCQQVFIDRNKKAAIC